MMMMMVMVVMMMMMMVVVMMMMESDLNTCETPRTTIPTSQLSADGVT